MEKRLLLMITAIASIILGVVIFVILSGGFTSSAIVLIVIVVLFLAYAIPKYIVNRNDKVGNDEYSKKTMRVITSRSYIVSLYTWLAMIWFLQPLEDWLGEMSTIIGFGIVIMAIVFLVNVIIVKIAGVPD
jgi:peptidoglycan/LPS O-acetylase OafA/YrhL